MEITASGEFKDLLSELDKEMNALNTTLRRITYDFSPELSKITLNTDRAKLKMSLRPCMLMLDELYSRI